MRRRSAWLAALVVTGLAVTVTAGCGTGRAAPPADGGQVARTTPAAGPAHARSPSGCRGTLPLITLADNGKTFCARVGATVSVLLRSGNSHPWLPLLASGRTLVPVPSGAGTLIRGATGGWFRAVRPGRALVTSVRPPCEVAISAGKGDLQPADPVATSYPLRSCAPGHRFSVSVVVVG